MSRAISAFLILVFASLVPAFSALQDSPTIPTQDDKVVIPGDDENAVARRDSMRTKLLFSQNILHGLTTGNFQKIKDGVKGVHEITEGEAWIAIDDDKYRELTAEFKTTIKRLGEAVDSGNLEATSLRFYNMSTSCIDCHQHIRKANYEF